MTKQTIGEFLATLRKANGYTQQEVADRLGISNRTLSGWECDNVLPDILLLPALAEMYGVTVDEILAGERKEKTDVELSNKSEKRILKGKLARFNSHCYLLLGLIILGVTLVAACVFVPASVLGLESFVWWFTMIGGIILAAVCMADLFSYWKGAEMFGEDISEEYSSYSIILRKKFSTCLYIIGAVCAALTVAIADFLIIGKKAIDSYEVIEIGIAACVAFGGIAVAFFTTGWLLYKNALSKNGGEAALQSIKKDRRYFCKVGLWGLIPLVLCVILVIVLNCVHYEKKTTLYQNADVGEFVKYMESIRGTDKEHYFPLSDIAKTAQRGDEFDLGDGYVAVYTGFSFQIRNEKLVMVDGRGSELNISYFSITVPQIVLVNGEKVVTFYNLRYWKHYDEGVFSVNITNPTVRPENFTFEHTDDGWAYVHVIRRDYSVIGNSIACTGILADLIVCAALCVWKRNQFTVKL